MVRLCPDLDLLLHLLAALAQLLVVLGQQIHLQLQLVDVSLQLLLQLQTLSSALHLHIQTGLQRLQRPLVALSVRAEEEKTAQNRKKKEERVGVHGQILPLKTKFVA